MTDMSINIPIVLGLAAIIMIAVILYVCIRRRLQAIVKDKNESITEELYGYDAGKRQLENEINGRTKSHDDINDFVESKFADSFITHENEREIKDFFNPLYVELSALLKRMNIFSITDEKITDFIYQYEHISNLVKQHMLSRKIETSKLRRTSLTISSSILWTCSRERLSFQRKTIAW